MANTDRVVTDSVGRACARLSREGFWFRRNLIDSHAIANVRADLSDVSRKLPAGAIVCGPTGKHRIVFGPHRVSDTVAELAFRGPWIDVIRASLGTEIYLFQSKVTIKDKNGDGWPWHQDIWKWQRRDGIVGSELLTAVIFVDTVERRSGGLSLIPKTHREFAPWSGDRLEMDDEAVTRALEIAPSVTPLGPAGSLLVFHSAVVHGSQPNRSASTRRLLFFTYNRCGNAPGRVLSPWWYSETFTTALGW